MSCLSRWKAFSIENGKMGNLRSHTFLCYRSPEEEGIRHMLGVVFILSSEVKFSVSPPEQGISFPNQMWYLSWIENWAWWQKNIQGAFPQVRIWLQELVPWVSPWGETTSEVPGSLETCTICCVFLKCLCIVDVTHPAEVLHVSLPQWEVISYED